MKIGEISVGDKILFVGCGDCTGKKVCFFCRKKVKPEGFVVSKHIDYDIPTVEVNVKGSPELLELTQDDLEDPELVQKVILYT